MKPSRLTAVALAVCTAACTKATGNSAAAGDARVGSSLGRSVWKEDDSFVSSFSKKQDANLLRMAQERAAAEKALEEQEKAARKSVPPSMYRTTEPPLPEPDLSLPVQDIPRSSPSSSPKPGQ
jgi:hypothetical protein